MDGAAGRPQLVQPERPIQYLHSLLNAFTFRRRQFLSWTPGEYRERGEPKDDLFGHLPVEAGRSAESARREIEARYDLAPLERAATRARYRETLAYLAFLETFFEKASLPEARPLSWLDVGVRNWSYVEAPYRFLEKACGPADFTLAGVEIDPNRRFTDLHTRASYARSYIRNLPAATFRAEDVMRIHEPYHTISVFLPFVYREPCLAWGLPLSCFNPGEQLAHLLEILAPGGLLLIQNQGPDEAAEQERLLRSMADRFRIEWEATGPMPDRFMRYQHTRYGFICKKSRSSHSLRAMTENGMN